MGGPANRNGRHLLESWLRLGEASEHDPALRSVLVDPVTGLPTAPQLFPRIGSLLEERGEVSVLCVSVVRYSHIEEIYGWQVLDDIMRAVAGALDEITGERLRDADMLAELMHSGSAFVIVLSPPRDSERIDPAARVALAHRVEVALAEKLAERVDPALSSKFGCYVGAATVERDEAAPLERHVYDALDQALADAHAREDAGAVERMARLRELLSGDEIHTLLQPVFDLESMEVAGYEALTRGREGSEFERPDKLFSVAYDASLVMRLERVCRKSAFEAAAALPPGRLLFVNLEPDAVNDPHLRDAAAGPLADGGLDPSCVVIELSERAAVANLSSFRAAVDYLRALGYVIAVDDAGAGYGSLQCLSEVRPQWLKVDGAVVKGCDTDSVRALLIGSLVTSAEQVGARLMVEGIETEEELATVRSLGVRYGQGYLLGRPCLGVPDDATLPAAQYRS